MKVLYYAPQYHLEEGGRTHARCFFRELARDPRVFHAVLFPPEHALRPPEEDQRLHRSVHRHLPFPLRNQIELLLPSTSTYADLSAAIAKNHIDAAVLRLGSRFRWIERLKRDHSSLRLCIEYNACSFDERLKGIPGERFWRREEARQLSKADCVGVVSDPLRRYLVSMRPSMDGSIFVNPNGGDPNTFKPADPATRARLRDRMGIPADALVVGYVGGMEAWRDVPEIVTWVAKARHTRLPRLFLVLIGAGNDLPRVLATIRDLSACLSGHVYCSGRWVPSPEVPPLITAFDVGLLSFQHPHCCQQKAFEYLLCGLPVIGPAGSVPRGLRSASYGTFEFAHGCESFVTLLDRLQGDLASARVSALRGGALVAAKYTWTANASRVVDALERVL